MAAWDAAAYRMAVAHETAQISAARALSASSAWTAGWDESRAGADVSWDLARGDARGAGRDAALAVAMQAAWTATGNTDRPLAWPAAMEAAAAVLEAPARSLERALISLVRTLVQLEPVQQNGRR
jgi:hypothetical protein